MRLHLWTDQRTRHARAVGLQARPASDLAGPVDVTVRLVTCFDDLEKLAADWDRLWAASAASDVFGKFTWARAWWTAHREHCSLCTPVVFEQGRPIGLLPLVLRGRTWRFLGAPERDYGDVLCEPGRETVVVRETLQAAAALVGRGQRCELEDIPEESVIAHHLAVLPPTVLSRLQFRPSCPCPTVTLGERSSGAVPSILRKESLRRHRNRLQRLGRVTFRHLTDRSEIKQHLPRFYRIHKARRAFAGGRSSFDTPEARMFCEALVAELDPARELRFGVLELDGQPIAYHLGLESREKLLWYKPAFDVAYWNYSPGEVMFGHLLEYARDQQLRELDLTRGGETFKNRFATGVRQNYTLEFYARGLRGWALHRSHLLKQWVKTHHAGWFAFIKGQHARVDRWSHDVSAQLRRGDVLSRTRQLGAKIVRATLFRRDEVLVFVDGGKIAKPAVDRRGHEDLVIAKGTLADLAEVAADHPDYLDRPRLSRANQRLRNGDLVYIARCGGRVAHVHWAGLRREIVTSEAGANLRIPLTTPATVAYDAWTAPGFRGIGLHTRVMQAVLHDSRAIGRRQWCYCTAANAASRRAIEHNGFRCVYRLVRIRLLGWTRTRIDHVADVDPGGE